MKALFFTLVWLVASFSVSTAQTEKGRWMVGAQVGNFQFSTQNQYSSFSGSISPSAGYFMVNNLVVGTGIPLSLAINNYADPNGDIHNRSTSVGLSPYVRYFIGSNKLKPYVGVSYAYSKSNQRTESGYQTTKTGGFTSSVIPTVGVAYFINRSVALNAGLNYVWSQYDNGYSMYDASGNPIERTTYTSKYLSLDLGFHIFLGK